MTGDELIGMARMASTGDESALDGLLKELRPEIVRVSRLIVGVGSASAEDAAQDALLDIARSIRDLRDPQAIRAWALRIAARRALRISRRERSLTHVLARIGRGQPTFVDIDHAGFMFQETFNMLPPRMRAVAVLRLYVGLSEYETARILDCSIGTVKSQLNAARKRLQQVLLDDAPASDGRERLPKLRWKGADCRE